MKFVIACLMALTLAACSSDSDKKGGGQGGFGGTGGSGNGSNGSGPQEQMKNETNYAACNNFPNRTNIEGMWYILQSQNGFQISTTLNIRNNQIQVSNMCKFEGSTLTAAVTVPATYDNGILNILESKEKTEKINNGDFSMDCSVRMDAMQARYSFQGSCLVLSPPQGVQGEDIVFAPR